ncbi:MAG: hypothetical protein ACOX5G_03675 [Kiritimatiellia bacterium]|jgi:alpha-galactosidase/6-phospho-beta-glucosidase family protein
MTSVFLGGGSLRLIPVLRGTFAASPGSFRGGEIRLVDRDLCAARAVANLLARCPEFPGDCTIAATDNIDAAFDGCDVLYITMAAERPPMNTQALLLSDRHGYLCSDQLSLHGAFLAARIGGQLFSFARTLEKRSPKARMLIFANPVAIYSAMVGNHTSISALGICGGFNNHRWDLSRLCGRDEFDPAWDVVAAGVNHLAFILRGTRNGRDIHEILAEHLVPDWTCMPIRTGFNENFNRHIEVALRRYADLYRRTGTLVFSTEGDGMGHLFHEEYLAEQRAAAERIRPGYDPEEDLRAATAARAANLRRLCAAAASPAPPDWSAKGGLFWRDDTDITRDIFRAFSGTAEMRIMASRPNRGAVIGFDGRAALEYTMDLRGDTITPVPDQYVPHPWQGLVASLSEFQTLVADALATQDPRLFAQALDCYPMNRGAARRREYFRGMFDIYKGQMMPGLESARDLV